MLTIVSIVRFEANRMRCTLTSRSISFLSAQIETILSEFGAKKATFLSCRNLDWDLFAVTFVCRDRICHAHWPYNEIRAAEWRHQEIICFFAIYGHRNTLTYNHRRRDAIYHIVLSSRAFCGPCHLQNWRNAMWFKETNRWKKSAVFDDIDDMQLAFTKHVSGDRKREANLPIYSYLSFWWKWWEQRETEIMFFANKMQNKIEIK